MRPLQSLLGQLALSDIEEHRGEAARFRLVGTDFEPPSKWPELRLEVRGLAGESHLPIPLEPHWFGIREQLKCGPSHELCGLQARMALKCRVELEVAQIARLTCLVADDLIDRKTFAHRFKQGPELRLASAQSFPGQLAL